MSTTEISSANNASAALTDIDIIYAALMTVGEAMVSMNFARRTTKAGEGAVALAAEIGRRHPPAAGLASVGTGGYVSAAPPVALAADDTLPLILAELRNMRADLVRTNTRAPAEQTDTPVHKLPAISVALSALMQGVLLARDDSLNRLMHSLAIKFNHKDIGEWMANERRAEEV